MAGAFDSQHDDCTMRRLCIWPGSRGVLLVRIRLHGVRCMAWDEAAGCSRKHYAGPACNSQELNVWMIVILVLEVVRLCNVVCTGIAEW